MGKPWSQDEINYLCDRWGTSSIPAIAQKLNRSVDGVKIKAYKLGLGAVLMSGDYITFNQLYEAVTGTQSHSYQNISWLKNRDFPMHHKRVNQCTFKIVYLDEFWEWAEKNRSFLDFTKFEPLSLGQEPEWVAEQRKIDFQKKRIAKKTPWTVQEDERLKCLLRQHKYTYPELAALFHRSEGGIQRRIMELSIKDRPVKIDNHGPTAIWTEEHYKIVAEGIRSGQAYALIAQKIGKSEKALRGKIYNVYFTENADKVRAMLGNGEWGHGAPPSPTVKQGKTLSGHRVTIKKELTDLVTILRYHVNKMGYEPYWQRLTCQHWYGIMGCSAGGTDCDSCTEYQRIKPQYCSRCGGTFYERRENKFCAECREARKKQAQKHWARTNRKAG